MEGSTEKRIPFGLKNGRLIGVEEVTPGLSCGCVCPKCNQALQANKGEVRAHYFSHNPNSEQPECEGAFETAIHKMAKQILAEEGFISLPSLKVSRFLDDNTGTSHSQESLVTEEENETFSKVVLEQRVNDIRPDIIGYTNNTPFLVEIAVTHFADRDKKTKIRSLGLASIEIDLSDIDYRITESELKELVVSKRDNKKWLSNPKAVGVISKLESTLNARVKEINAGHNKAKQSQENRLAQKRAEFRAIQQQPTAATVSASSKQYDPRWFVCEACRHLFRVPLTKAPYSLQTIPCPECEYDVSALPPRGYHA
ncbi:MAG: hypothetical protein JMN27_17605 [gamma proteobacterium endosymbiont of Lamellibrachia anaximandri]|nr:hypothetical protein [gamma proteobacterium endosymbiont of Lamellibrachia anaximandri]MBL3535624.1 hypothetical protein [gamma proteobacterium endosymbiont of Lamellibrachia anaximandri]